MVFSMHCPHSMHGTQPPGTSSGPSQHSPVIWLHPVSGHTSQSLQVNSGVPELGQQLTVTPVSSSLSLLSFSTCSLAKV